MQRGEKAKELFLSGCNCCQAVVLAFNDKLNIDALDLKKLAIGFGAGFGRQRLVCGAVSGMTMVLGGILSDGVNKQEIYALVQKACEKFKKELGSIICADLLEGKVNFNTSPVPENRNDAYYKKRPCADICEIAGNIVEEILNELNV